MLHVALRPSALLFNADCNEQVFLLNPEKNFGSDPSCRFREKRTFNSEKWRSFRLPETMISGSLKLTFRLLTV